MNGFDELGDEYAGDEANEEWDAVWAAYTAGDQVDTETGRSELQATLTLPLGTVELRGEATGIPSLLVAPYEAQESVGIDDREDHKQGPGQDEFEPVGSMVAMTLTVLSAEESSQIDGRSVGPTRWSITDGAGYELRAGSGEGSPDEVALLEQILELSVMLDERHAYLDAACVELDGRGILMVGPNRVEVAAATEQLLSEGAAYLTERLVVLHPGTRAVDSLAFSNHSVPHDNVLRRCSIDVVVFLDSTADQPVSVGAGEAVALLLERVPAISNVPKLAFSSIVEVVAGATCVRLSGSQDSSATAAIRAVESVEIRRMSVVSDCPESLRERFDTTSGADSNATDPNRADHAPIQFVRFDDSGVLTEGVARSIVLDATEADEVEGALVTSRRRKPKPAEFGLPGCPIGAEAGRLWSTTSLEKVAGGENDRSGLPSGVIAELVARELLAVDSDDRGWIASRALDSQDRLGSATTVLADLLATADRLGIQPVVLGALAQALDGPLPAHFVDVDRIELLVPAHQIEALLAGLENDGFVHEAITLNLTALDGAPTVQMHHHSEPSLSIELHRTLASGPFGVLVDPDAFNRSSVPVRVGDRWTWVLHPSHRFVHSCLRADRAGPSGVSARREVVLNAPRTAALVDDAIACSEQWGATTTLMSVVRDVAGDLSGLPAPLSALVNAPTEGKKRHRLGTRRAERQGRR